MCTSALLRKHSTYTLYTRTHARTLYVLTLLTGRANSILFAPRRLMALPNVCVQDEGQHTLPHTWYAHKQGLNTPSAHTSKQIANITAPMVRVHD